jgi:hypothetical protein
LSASPDGILAALAEAVVAGRLFALAGAQFDQRLPITWTFPLAALSHLAGQIAAGLASRKPEGRDRRTLLGLWLISGACVASVVFFAGGRLGFVGILIYLLIWMLCSARGIAMVTQARSSDAVRSDLVWGTVALACASVFRRDGGVTAVAETGCFLLICSALLVVKRRREITERIAAQDRLPWAAGGLGFVCLVLVAVLVLYAAGSGGFGTIVSILSTGWDYLAIALGYMMIPVAYLAQRIIAGFQRVFSGRSTEAWKMPGSLADELAKQFGENQRLIRVPEWAKWTALALALACVGGIVWVLVSRFFKTPERQVIRETRVSLVHGGVLKEWLQDAAEGLKGLASEAASRLRSLVGREPRTLEGIYAATLDLLAGRGIPREPQLTPYEYRDLAHGEIPIEEGREALAEITALFTECHYSVRPPLAQELLAARAAYRQLSSVSFRVASAQAQLTRDPGG